MEYNYFQMIHFRKKKIQANQMMVKGRFMQHNGKKKVSILRKTSIIDKYY